MDREEQYERFLGVKTDDEEVIIGKDSKRKYSTYEASEYEGLVRIFDEISLNPHDTLVDFGCGMGRVLFYCNQRFMCKVTGIEYDGDVYKKLSDNAEYYHVRFREQRRKFSLLNMKAEDYLIEPTDNVFYFFNPFSMDVLESIIEKIIESVRLYSRKATLILYYCTYDIMRTFRKYPFVLHSIIKLPAYVLDPDEKAYIYTLEQWNLLDDE